MNQILMSAALFHFHAAQHGSIADQFAGCRWQFGGLTRQLLAWAMFCR